MVYDARYFDNDDDDSAFGSDENKKEFWNTKPQDTRFTVFNIHLHAMEKICYLPHKRMII